MGWLRSTSRFTCAALTLLVGAAVAAHPGDTPDPAVAEHLARVLAEDVAQADHFDAKVWLLSAEPKLERFVRNADERAHILRHVYRESLRNGIDPDLVMAVMQVESAFDRFAVSRAGAQGLMQVMTFWRSEIGRPNDNLTDIETSIRYGTAILAHYLDVSRGDLIDALARYNGSRGRLRYPERVIGAYRRTWQTTATEELPLLKQGCEQYALVACGQAGY